MGEQSASVPKTSLDTRPSGTPATMLFEVKRVRCHHCLTYSYAYSNILADGARFECQTELCQKLQKQHGWKSSENPRGYNPAYGVVNRQVVKATKQSCGHGGCNRTCFVPRGESFKCHHGKSRMLERQ